MAEPIVFERVIDASPDEAFDLFTQPERLRRWQAVSASVDLRVGGDYRLTIIPGNIATGTFTEVEPGKRIVYSWGWQDNEANPPGSSTIEVDIEPVGERTRVRLTHTSMRRARPATPTVGSTTATGSSRPPRAPTVPTPGALAPTISTTSVRPRRPGAFARRSCEASRPTTATGQRRAPISPCTSWSNT